MAPLTRRRLSRATWCARAGSLAAYTQLLLVPLMARMSDALPAVRRTASPTFAALVALVPIAQVSAHKCPHAPCTAKLSKPSLDDFHG